MFKIGEKISYPMHGAGVIVGIEEQIILDQKRSYYVLRISHGDMKVMVPVANSVEVGVRYIIDESKLQAVLEVLSSESTPMEGNWNKRSRENMDKLKTGDLCLVAEVVRNLMRNDRKKKLSTGEKKILGTAIGLLVSEMVLVREMTAKEAQDLIETSVFAEAS
ncbi:MAG: CarD family transcriptional regulator [Firmicutes bacterium]|nr:CarD family transcriptional regulator [Bacillota bacterium]